MKQAGLFLLIGFAGAGAGIITFLLSGSIAEDMQVRALIGGAVAAAITMLGAIVHNIRIKAEIERQSKEKDGD